jgi:hypothetical protein
MKISFLFSFFSALNQYFPHIPYVASKKKGFEVVVIRLVMCRVVFDLIRALLGLFQAFFIKFLGFLEKRSS